MSQSTGVMGDFTLGSANADLSTKTFYGVYVHTDGTVKVADASNRPIGVLQNKPKITEACAVRVEGTSKLVVDGATGGATAAIAIGAKLKANASGQGINSSTDGDEVFAIALQASTAVGDIIEAMLVNRQG